MHYGWDVPVQLEQVNTRWQEFIFATQRGIPSVSCINPPDFYILFSRLTFNFASNSL